MQEEKKKHLKYLDTSFLADSIDKHQTCDFLPGFVIFDFMLNSIFLKKALET